MQVDSHSRRTYWENLAGSAHFSGGSNSSINNIHNFNRVEDNLAAFKAWRKVVMSGSSWRGSSDDTSPGRLLSFLGVKVPGLVDNVLAILGGVWDWESDDR